MRHIAFITMSLETFSPVWPRILCLGLMLAWAPVFAADAPAARSDSNTITSPTPMEIVAEDTGAHGQLVVAPEVISADTRADLVYAITAEPAFGRVGLAGGDDEAD